MASEGTGRFDSKTNHEMTRRITKGILAAGLKQFVIVSVVSWFVPVFVAARLDAPSPFVINCPGALGLVFAMWGSFRISSMAEHSAV